jgi:hypothetical protein
MQFAIRACGSIGVPLPLRNHDCKDLSVYRFVLFLFFLSIRAAFACAGDVPPSIDAGFRKMYNLEFQAAHKTFESWQERHPGDPLGPVSNAAAYLFGEFDRLHILDLALFENNKKLEDRGKLISDPAVKAAFETELSKADNLAAKILENSSEDADALFASLLAEGLRGYYAGLIEQENRDALKFLKSSRSIAEKLIKIDPEYHDAYLAIGVENYLLGLRSAPMRWALRISGAQTDKEKGLATIAITADKGRYLAPYAQLLLVIGALRNHDQNTAKRILSELAREFPENSRYQAELSRLRS